LTQEQQARQELARRELIRRRVFRDKDLPFLISLMTAVDQGSGGSFAFPHVELPLDEGEVTVDGNTVRSRDHTWRWQRFVVDTLLNEKRVMFLKGRQIGVTWVVLAVDVAEALTRPNTVSLIYRQREDDAIDNVQRWWTLYHSLPTWLTGHIKVIRPSSAPLPGRDGIQLRFPSGAISSVIPMTSASGSGHGRTVRHVMLDEAAHIENLAGIGAAVGPAVGKGRISIISTANGRHNPETGEGNEFHRRWEDEGNGYTRLFLPYDVHPDRDEVWYETSETVRELKPWQRQEQFPRNEHEAFALSDRSFFDQDSLLEYTEKTSKLLRRYDFEVVAGGARLADNPNGGRVRVYGEPKPGVTYAIGADVATGRGADYSAAYVIDLSSMEIVAEYHSKIEADIYARDLHFLGRRYNDALIAIESAGGFGEAVIIALRDGVTGRPRYPKLYKHVMSSRPDRPVAKTFGFPTNVKTRPLVLNQMEQALREKALPAVPGGLLSEMAEFVYHDHGTSPRAREGSRDDRVMAAAITLEMYRLYGSHPNKTVRKARRGNTVGLGRDRREKVSAGVDDSRYKQAV
jgi:hypothetical protein